MSKIELDRNNKTLYGQIADILRERIMSGEFKPGDILPSERELAEEMQVSRIPVREAMKSLEYLGVVKQIRGKGVLVQTADLSNILKVVGTLVTTITPQILLNLFDFRLAIEPYGAAQAAKLATEAEIKTLQEILEVQKTAVENNQMSEEMSFEFHLRLMQASHNEVIATVSLFLSELQRQSRHLTLWNKVRREDAYCEHKKVFEAIKNHDSELAFQIMKNHLLEAKEQLPRE